MFHLSIIGTKNGANAISVSRKMSLHNIRDESKKFKKLYHISEKGKSRIELYMIYTLLQFCNDSLSGYDIKRAEISRLKD